MGLTDALSPIRGILGGVFGSEPKATDRDDNQSDSDADSTDAPTKRVSSQAYPRTSTSLTSGVSARPGESKQKAIIADLQAELRETQKQLQTLDKQAREQKQQFEYQVSRLQGKVKARDDEVDHFRRAANHEASQRRTAEEKISEAQAQYSKACDALYHWQSRFKNAEKEYGALQATLEQKEALYATQALELRATQTFLSTADSVPGAQIVQSVRDLNSEVQQTAAMLSELFGFTSSTKRAGPEIARSCSELQFLLGGTLIESLRSRDHSEDPTLVQTALQALLAAALAHYVSNWTVDEDQHSAVKTLYSYIRQDEVQAVAGRWRALTARHLRLHSKDPKSSGDTLADFFVKYLALAFVVSGCSEDRDTVLVAIAQRFNSKLRTLIAQALRLGTLLHEEVTSTDFEVVHLPAGSVFHADFAEDEYAKGDVDATGSGSHPILCTTDLGLRQLTKVDSAQGQGTTSTTEVLLLKPKVLLENAVDEM